MDCFLTAPRTMLKRSFEFSFEYVNSPALDSTSHYQACDQKGCSESPWQWISWVEILCTDIVGAVPALCSLLVRTREPGLASCPPEWDFWFLLAPPWPGGAVCCSQLPSGSGRSCCCLMFIMLCIYCGFITPGAGIQCLSLSTEGFD